MATLSAERLAVLLAYCKLTELKDDPEVKLLIPLFYDAAVEYLADAGVPEPDAAAKYRSRYDLCVNAMVLDSWDHRDTHEEGTVTVNPAWKSLKNQLKITDWTADVSESGTSVL